MSLASSILLELINLTSAYLSHQNAKPNQMPFENTHRNPNARHIRTFSTEETDDMINTILSSDTDEMQRYKSLPSALAH